MSKSDNTSVTLAEIKRLVASGKLSAARGAELEKHLRDLQAATRELNKVKRLIRTRKASLKPKP